MIVMSNHYWNEYIKYFVNDGLLIDTLKYHQRTCRKKFEAEKNEEIIKLCKANEIRCSDIKYGETVANDAHIDRILASVRKFYRNLEIKVSFPVFVFFNDKYVKSPGVYSYDFEKKIFLLIGNMEEGIYEAIDKAEMREGVIAFFLDITKAMAIYGNRGYIKGIEEIGYLCNGLMAEFQELDVGKTLEQEFTHRVGINLRKALLIDLIII